MKKLLLPSLALASIIIVSGCRTVEERDRRHHRHDTITTTTTEETRMTRPSYGAVETQTTRSY